MHYDDDLEAIDQAVRREAVAADMVVFPRAPWSEGPGPGGPLVADWPDGDWEGFVGKARQVGVRLFYVQLEHFSEWSLEAMRERFREVADDAPVWDEADPRLGTPFALEAAWMHDGVVHRWSAEAVWYRDLEERVHTEHERASANQTERIERMAQTVAHDSDMPLAGSLPEAHKLVARHFPNETEVTKRKAGMRASDLYLREVRPRREAAIAQYIQDMRREDPPRSLRDIARECGLSEHQVKRIREQHSID